MTVAAIFDEGGLQRRLYPGDLGKIDVAFELFLARRLEVKFFKALSADDHDPGFFRVGGIDQHTFGHLAIAPMRDRHGPPRRGAAARSCYGCSRLLSCRPVERRLGESAATPGPGPCGERTQPGARRQIRSAEPVRRRLPRSLPMPGATIALGAGSLLHSVVAPARGIMPVAVGRTKPDLSNINMAAAADNGIVRGVRRDGEFGHHDAGWTRLAPLIYRGRNADRTTI